MRGASMMKVWFAIQVVVPVGANKDDRRRTDSNLFASGPSFPNFKVEVGKFILIWLFDYSIAAVTAHLKRRGHVVWVWVLNTDRQF